MLVVAAAGRKLVDAVLSILIEWPPCGSRVERPRRCARGVLRRPGQWATDWCGTGDLQGINHFRILRRLPGYRAVHAKQRGSMIPCKPAWLAILWQKVVALYRAV